MSLAVQINANQTSLTCERGKECDCAFDVKNASEANLRIGLDTLCMPANEAWTKVLDRVEIKLPSKAMEKVVVRVRVPADGATGKRTFRLRAYDANMPSSAVESAPVAVMVPEAKVIAIGGGGKVDVPDEWNWKLILAIAGGIVLLLGALAWIFWPRGDPVPRVIALNVPAAEARLTNAGFTRGDLELIEADESPPGTVIEQSPEAGKRAAPGTPVNLVVVKQLVTVPQLVGLMRDVAIARLAEVGLSPGDTSTQFVEGKDPLTVLSHQPVAGERVDAGFKVNLVVQDTAINVPSVVDLPLEKAVTTLVTAGLKVATITHVDVRSADEVNKIGTIRSQDPLPGKLVKPGADATLVVRAVRNRPIFDFVSPVKAGQAAKAARPPSQ